LALAVLTLACYWRLLPKKERSTVRIGDASLAAVQASVIVAFLGFVWFLLRAPAKLYAEATADTEQLSQRLKEAEHRQVPEAEILESLAKKGDLLRRKVLDGDISVEAWERAYPEWEKEVTAELSSVAPQYHVMLHDYPAYEGRTAPPPPDDPEFQIKMNSIQKDFFLYKADQMCLRLTDIATHLRVRVGDNIRHLRPEEVWEIRAKDTTYVPPQS